MKNIFIGIILSFCFFVISSALFGDMFSVCGAISSFILFIIWVVVEWDELSEQRRTEHSEIGD